MGCVMSCKFFCTGSLKNSTELSCNGGGVWWGVVGCGGVHQRRKASLQNVRILFWLNFSAKKT